jgi:hypothetical protein
LTPELNARHVLQMNIQHKAGGIGQVRALKKAFNTAEDLGLESMELQHPLQRPEDTWVIVDNDDQMACAHD